MNRKDIGSWLSGPRAALEEQGLEFGYPGERFGMPKTGTGSAARFVRRILALALDWFAAILVTNLIFSDLVYGESDFGVATLAVFALQVTILTATTGSSFGYKILGLRLVSVSAAPLNFLKVLARTALLCLVIPAMIWDRDGRGMHDKIVGSIVMKSK